MKKLLLLIALMMPMASFAQGEEKKDKTTFEKFTSSIGSIVKFIDYKMPVLETSYERAQVTVRKVTNNNSSQCFLKIEFTNYNKREYSAFIAYEDVVELAKALEQLKTLAENDGTGDANYLENKFRTKDRLYLGYYIDKNKNGDKAPTWFISLEGYTSSNLYFKSAEPLLETFNTAINKIKEIQ